MGHGDRFFVPTLGTRGQEKRPSKQCQIKQTFKIKSRNASYDCCDKQGIPRWFIKERR